MIISIIKTYMTFAACLLSFISVSGQYQTMSELVSDERRPESDFCLFSEREMADIIVDSQDNQTVRLAASLFRDDIERVSSRRPIIREDTGSGSANCVIIGSIPESRIIKKLIKKNKIDVREIEGQWEACIIMLVTDPFEGIDSALVIAGSDRRGTAYGVLEISKQMGVSPWHFFADVPPKKKDAVYINAGPCIQPSPSVKYRGIFINDEIWGIKPWALHTYAPDEGKGLGPKTYATIFELLLRLKANTLWPAMHPQGKPFNYHENNKIVADKYGIVMGSSHIEPMLRNNIYGAEWDREYPGEPWDYAINGDHIYKYWEKRIRENSAYENIYTIGKRGKDDEAGSDITVPVLEGIFNDQREILKKYVNKEINKVPQVLIPYTEVLELYNEGLKVPDDVIICWPDDNFGNIRQLPDKDERERSGGSGVYYHFQWLNGATTAYTWTCTTPLALIWSEMKKAYDFNARKLWIANVGDIKPAEINIEYFMQMAWDISLWDNNNSKLFLSKWAAREFGEKYASRISDIMQRHYELGYARRPEHMMMYDARNKELSWEWFSINNYNDEAQKRIDDYDKLIKEVDEIYDALPIEFKDAFFEMVVYNVKGTALQNQKILYAQKSIEYGKQGRASAASYSCLAQQAENDIYKLINHYNRELVTHGNKWDYMASLPGPAGNQYRQWDMPPLSFYSGNSEPRMKLFTEGGENGLLPVFSVYNEDKLYIDLFNAGHGSVSWSSEVSDNWIKLSETSGVIYDEKRIWISIDWDKAPKGASLDGTVSFNWSSMLVNEWVDYQKLSEKEKKEIQEGIVRYNGPDSRYDIKINIFNPSYPAPGQVDGFVESNGYISMEAENFSHKKDSKEAAWEIIEGLGRSGNSVTVLPPNISSIDPDEDNLSNSPLLEYDIYTFSRGPGSLQLNCIPSFPINKEYGQRLAIALDDEIPMLIQYESGRNVIDNLMLIKGELDFKKEGRHILKIWMIDPGIVIDKIIINTGGLKDSYLGPPQSFLNNRSLVKQ